MMRRILLLSTLLALLTVSRGVSHVAAQSAPADLGFVCGGVNLVNGQATCELRVPSDTIGSELDINIPTDQFSLVSNLQQGSNLSNSSAFFKLELSEASGKARLQIDFADLSAEPFSTSAYALVTIDFTLSSFTPTDFPKTVDAELAIGSQLFDPASLSQSDAAFTASNIVVLPLVFSLDGATTNAAPSEITSSFSFEGGGGGGGSGATPAADFYCFDDPRSSMTDAEWIIICDAKRRGIISGNPREDGIFFFPNQPINRAEAVKIVTLGVLRSLGKLSDADFDSVQQAIEDAFPDKVFITYIDILYESGGVPPWFAVFVNIATDNAIVHGYREDNTYRAVNKIVNAESYRIIVEAGRVASDAIASTLTAATASTIDQEWFMKYSETLDQYGVAHDKEYAKFTARKDFLIVVMNLLAAVGL